MAIHFACSCGRGISAKDEHAGKKGKCPACGRVIQVPTPGPSPARGKESHETPPPIAIALPLPSTPPLPPLPVLPQTGPKAPPLAQPIPLATPTHMFPPIPLTQPPRTSEVHGFPWQQGKKFWQAMGVKAQEFLAHEVGHPVRVIAFETGVMGNVGLTICLSLLLMPFILVLAILMIIPSWIYLTCRTVAEWREARRLGVSPGWMIFTLLLMYGFGFFAGLVVSLMLINRILPSCPVVLVRTDEGYVILHQILKLFVPRFRRALWFPLTDVVLDVISQTQS